jgi:hypothetical protein
VIFDIGDTLSAVARGHLINQGFTVESFLSLGRPEAAEAFRYSYDRIAAVFRSDHVGVNFYTQREKELDGRKPPFPIIIIPKERFTPKSGRGFTLTKNVTQAIAGGDPSTLQIFFKESDNGDPSPDFQNQFNQALAHFYGVDAAMMDRQGGINLNGLRINRQKEGDGVVLKLDHAMLERLKRPDFAGFDFHIDFITTLPNLPMFLGLAPRPRPELDKLARLDP